VTKLNIVMQNDVPNLTEMIGIPCSHSKITAATAMAEKPPEKRLLQPLQ